MLLMMGLFIGCPTASEWDRQWTRLQEARNQGNLQEAKDILHDMLPVVRDSGLTDDRYGQAIFQLGEISRLEVKKPKRKRIIGRPGHCLRSQSVRNICEWPMR